MTTEETIEWIKCAKDPVYFLNSHGYVYDVMKQQVDKLTCFKYQEDIIKQFESERNNIVLKSRQTGLSVITAGYIAWKLIFSFDEKILIIANKGDSAVRFLEHVKQFLDNAPKFLLPDERVSQNQKLIKFSNGSWCKAVASSDDAGRGETLTMLVFDEAAFIELAQQIWASAGTALTASKGKCIMLSTPFGTGGLYHAIWTGSKKGENDFNRLEIHWSKHPIYSQGISERIDEYGKKYLTSPWYEAECERLQHDSVKIAQELDLSFESSRASVIEEYIIEKYIKNCLNIKPLCFYDYKEEGSGFVDRETSFQVWEKPKLNTNYILGVDVGRGDAADYSTIQVFDADNLIQVAEYQGKIQADAFAMPISKIAKEYNNAFVVVECNNFGLATSLALKNQIKYDPDRIYHSKSIKKIFAYDREYGSVNEGEEIPGFQTTTRTRPLIISTIIKYMKEGLVKINSTKLLDEFKTFVYNGDKAEHAKGYHDDLIFAFGIGLFIRDTEFENVFQSKQFYKAMLESISSSRSDIKKLNISNIENEKAVLYNKNANHNTNDDNDLNWLYGDISTG